MVDSYSLSKASHIALALVMILSYLASLPSLTPSTPSRSSTYEVASATQADEVSINS